MKPKTPKWIIAALLLVVSSTSLAATYPQSKGVVSDYAGKLSAAQVAELSSLIQAYERQTSIEIAVVVADSLQGQSVREYAIGLGNAWGVGRADRDNGVVLLWAPNERKYSLRIADGLSQDLGDADANEITRDNLLPNFRREDYYGGLKQTVNAVMARLGNESWEERLQARQQSQQKGDSSIEWFFPKLFAALGISAVLVVLLYRRRKRKLKLQEMAAIPEAVLQNLDVAQNNVPRIQKLLDDFKKEMPEQDLTRFTSELTVQPERIGKIRSDLASMDLADVTSYQAVLVVGDRAESESSLLSNTQWKLEDIRRAKAASQQMMESLSKEGFQISDVRDGAKRGEVDDLLSNSRSLYGQAYQNSSMSVLDWILINELLNRSQRQVQQAVQVSQQSPYAFTDYGSSTSSASDSSSWGSGADFGGGGHFGGGGGFDGGSGSDGSY